MLPLAAALGVRHVRHARRPLPSLRLSEEGIEGDFGLVRWADVESVEAERRWQFSRYEPYRSSVRIALRRGSQVLPATREFAAGPWLAEDVAEGTAIELARRSTDVERLAAQIRDFGDRVRRGSEQL